MPSFERLAIQDLNRWLKKKKRKPLIIRGARQVGKSTLVRDFAEKHRLDLVEINLEQQVRLDSIFASLNMEVIIKEIEALVQKKLSSKTLLFLDEIQATPHALAALRYFYEQHPQLPVIAAGSLLEFVLQDHDFSMPVGRIEYLHLGPMSFKEFLLAKQDEFLLDSLENFKFNEYYPQSLHEKFLFRLKEYMLVGGMPEAIAEYIESNSLEEVTPIQESILTTFIDDFAKYRRHKKDPHRLQNIFRYIPQHVGEKIKYSSISREDRSRETKEALELLIMAKVVSRIYHTTASGLPLHAEINPRVYKCLFLDVGLMNRCCGLNWNQIQEREKMDLINKGGIAEQFIGQHLLYRNPSYQEPQIHYWLREEKSTNAEVDYIIDHHQEIIPIEVKAGKAGRLKSLVQFYLHKKTPLMVRFDLNPPSLGTINTKAKSKEKIKTINYPLLSLPLYMVEELNRVIDLSLKK